MCPPCGSIDLNRMDVLRAPFAVLRARADAPAGDLPASRKAEIV
jgi:hypothetical protein